MNQEQMKSRCPDSQLIGSVFLNGYKIAFTIFSDKRNCGCADIVESHTDTVWGLLYEISETDLGNLDQAEGHPVHYQRLQVVVRDQNGEEHVAESYEVVTKQGEFLKPSKHYLGIMHSAAHEFEFEEVYKQLLSDIETVD